MESRALKIQPQTEDKDQIQFSGGRVIHVIHVFDNCTHSRSAAFIKSNNALSFLGFVSITAIDYSDGQMQ